MEAVAGEHGRDLFLLRHRGARVVALVVVLFALIGFVESIHATAAFSSDWFGRIPLMFERTGDKTNRYVCRNPGSTIAIGPEETVLFLQSKTNGLAAGPRGRGLRRIPQREGDEASRGDQGAVVRIHLLGANPGSTDTALDELPTTVNYFIGNDPRAWKHRVPAFAKVRFNDVYPGIDVVYYGNQRQLESDFVVRAGADPGQIRFNVSGAERVTTDPQGDLIIQTKAGPVHQSRPIVYQELPGGRREITSRYVIVSERSDDTPVADIVVCVEVGPYEAGKPLIVDPVLVYSGLLGGTGDDVGWSVAVGTDGNPVIVGETTSLLFFNNNALYPIFHGNPLSPGLPRDVFIAKVGSGGTNIIFSTYLGGTQDDAAYSVALDSSNNICLAGQTYSTDFPVTLDAVSLNIHGTNFYGYYPYDAFVTKLDASGSQLLYSTYLGGSRDDVAVGIAVDSADNVYVTGFTASLDYPTINSPPPIGGGLFDVFVTKLTASDRNLIYSVVFGGLDDDKAQSIAVDSAGNAVVTGFTRSQNFPVTPGAFSSDLHGVRDPILGVFPYDAFVTKLSADGTSMIYSTYLGGSADDEGFSVTVDTADNAYVTGVTSSTDFPVSNALYQTNSGSSDVFVTELDPGGANLIYSTYFGGEQTDEGWGITVGTDGSAYVVGSTTSTNLSGADPVQLRLRASSDVLVFGLAPGGTSLLYAAAFGGTGNDFGYGITLDNDGNAIVTGSSNPSLLLTTNDFPLLPPTNGLPHSIVGGLNDAFLTKIYPGSLSLSVQQAGTNNVAVFWPGLFSNHLLQSIDAFQATNIWTTVTNPPSLVGTNLVVTYTNTTSNAFYRLSAPQ
ncbi:MAG TPA: SBBP repeat-containing protein [Candidatus Nitrosotalea sp.]|nr:SBBP repeat-containing protein [Candidatus Nitrosotalea sp.]